MLLAMLHLPTRPSIILVADGDLGAWILTANIVTTAKYNTLDTNLYVWVRLYVHVRRKRYLIAICASLGAELMLARLIEDMLPATAIVAAVP